MVSGKADSKATAEYFNSRGELGGWLEATGLHCSPIGFGGYRVDDVSRLHAEAIRTALLSGCNLFDTSTNYTDGGSERAIGGAIEELTRVRVIDREQIIVVSKVGYVQGQALTLAQQREAEGTAFPEMVKYQPECWHCLHPDFLQVQLEKSRLRLGLECIDLYLLHNPEYFLMDAAKRPGDLAETRRVFYGRIQEAFEFLEEQVEKGVLQGYGVSSNTFGAPAGRTDACSLSEVWECARRAAQARGKKPQDHHFRVAQLPLNLYESGPFLCQNTGEGNAETALGFAAKRGIGVLVNRPLNAFHQNQLVRLADFRLKADLKPVAELLSAAAALEKEFQDTLAPAMHFGAGAPPPEEFFRWSEDLNQITGAAMPADRWAEVESQITSHVGQLCEQITAQVSLATWRPWRDRYLDALTLVLEAFRNEANARTQPRSAAIAAKLDPFLPEEWRSLSLSRKALGVLIHTPGVSCVLTGMRRASYVEDAMGAPRLPSLSGETVAEIFRAFH